jgi:predicted secreted protein
MPTSGKTHGRNLGFSLATQGGVAKVITGYIQDVDGLPGDRDAGDVTCAGAAGYSHLLGLYKASIKLTCVFDDTTDSAYDVVKNYLTDTAARAFIYYPAGNSSGFAKISGSAWITKVNIPTKVKDPVIFTVDMVTDGTITVGTV